MNCNLTKQLWIIILTITSFAVVVSLLNSFWSWWKLCICRILLYITTVSKFSACKRKRDEIRKLVCISVIPQHCRINKQDAKESQVNPKTNRSTCFGWFLLGPSAYLFQSVYVFVYIYLFYREDFLLRRDDALVFLILLSHLISPGLNFIPFSENFRTCTIYYCVCIYNSSTPIRNLALVCLV